MLQVFELLGERELRPAVLAGGEVDRDFLDPPDAALAHQFQADFVAQRSEALGPVERLAAQGEEAGHRVGRLRPRERPGQQRRDPRIQPAEDAPPLCDGAAGGVP